jgi:hypothetical protein
MSTMGKVVVKGPGGSVLCQFSQPMTTAIAHAKTLPPTIAARFPGLKLAGATPRQMKLLVKNGTIPAPTNPKLLKRAMRDLGDPPKIFRKPPHAHHELPWGIDINGRRSREVFAEFGFDVNDPQYGKWVEPKLHNQWHPLADVGWTAQWKTTLKELDNGDFTLEAGRQKILAKLSQMRGQYCRVGDGRRFPTHY